MKLMNTFTVAKTYLVLYNVCNNLLQISNYLVTIGWLSACLLIFLFITSIVFKIISLSILSLFLFLIPFSVVVPLWSILILAFIFELIKYNLEKKIQLNISDEKFNFLCHMIVRYSKTNKSSKLNLEIKKILAAIENQSSIYHDLSEEEFPYFNKFFKRYTICQNNKIKLKNQMKGIYTVTLAELERQKDESNYMKDMDKLNSSVKNPKLLTLDSVDNELNDMINGQFPMIKNGKVKVGDK